MAASDPKGGKILKPLKFLSSKKWWAAEYPGMVATAENLQSYLDVMGAQNTMSQDPEEAELGMHYYSFNRYDSRAQDGYVSFFLAVWGKHFPAQTGISLAFIPSANDYYQRSFATIGLVDTAYPHNSKQCDNAGNDLDTKGLWPSGDWYYKTQDEEGNVSAVQTNDNDVLNKLADGHEFKVGEKFDFCGCPKYQVKAGKRDDADKDNFVAAEGNGECIMMFKSHGGILILNWATDTYKGDARKKVGKLGSRMSDLCKMVNSFADSENETLHTLAWADEEKPWQ